MSKDAALQSLSEQLGATPPPGVTALTEKQLRDLAAAITEARHRQAAALSDAGDRALRRIPRLLRGPIRKVAGG